MFLSLSLAPYFGQGQEPEPICSNQSDGGMFHCSDRSIIPHYRVGNITCELDVASFAANSTQEIINENGNCCINITSQSNEISFTSIRISEASVAS